MPAIIPYGHRQGDGALSWSIRIAKDPRRAKRFLMDTIEIRSREIGEDRRFRDPRRSERKRVMRSSAEAW